MKSQEIIKFRIQNKKNSDNFPGNHERTQHGKVLPL